MKVDRDNVIDVVVQSQDEVAGSSLETVDDLVNEAGEIKAMSDSCKYEYHNNKKRKLIEVLAEKYGVDAEKMLNTLKDTVFRQKDNKEITNSQMMTLLIVAHEYNLNPFTKEIYAYPDRNGIVAVVGVDGWSRIINEHPQFDGVEFVESENQVMPLGSARMCYEWIECRLYRKDRSKPVCVKEYLDEVYRDKFSGVSQSTGKPYSVEGPWQTHPKRMLRHKALIQCARLAFGFTGIKDEDEAERIVTQQQSSVEKDSKPLMLDYSHLGPIINGLRSRIAQVGLVRCMEYAKTRIKSEEELEYVKNALTVTVH